MISTTRKANGGCIPTDGASESYLTYNPTLPSALNSLAEIRPGQSLWLRHDGAVRGARLLNVCCDYGPIVRPQGPGVGST